MLIHGLINGSCVNGPGLRAVIYFQGCTLGCPDCWNPETHAFRGRERDVAEIVDAVAAAHAERALEGVTFSGGEPMQQSDSLSALIESLHDRLPGLSFGMYSGYSERELSSGRYSSRSGQPQLYRKDLWRRIQSRLDFAVLGRYIPARPSVLALRTSSNQQLAIFSGRYREEDFTSQECEIHIDTLGTVQITGFPTAGMPVAR